MRERTVERPHLYPDLHDWPIYRLHADRETFVGELEAESLAQLTEQQPDLVALLQSTIFSEKNRARREPWKVDPQDDLAYWRRAEQKFVRSGLDEDDPTDVQARRELLQRIVHRYAEEVVGSFKIPTFQFARRFLTAFFNRLLNAAAGRNLRRLARAKVKLRDRLIVSGQVERLRTLFPEHHVLILPTHFSNLDSILIGYALDGFAGIPHSTFGAGLNLLNSGWVAYFINRFGAYRVDRRKKNPIYLEVLKSFSRLAIYKGVNSTFFPGGTRNRAGTIEREVKLGLLGTAVEAQRRLLAEGSDKKVIVVPLVLSYHFVLEAKFLIQEHLRRTGKEQYLGAPSRQFGYRTFLSFLWQLFASTSEIHLNVGQPLDVLGNPVDSAGTSFDDSGRPLDLRDYFYSGGEITVDPQREREYTKRLGVAVVDRFHRDHVVLTSHIVAYAAFRILRQSYPELDLYAVLRLVEEDFLFDLGVLQTVIAHIQAKLFELAERGAVKLSANAKAEPAFVLEDGISHMSLYHQRKPLTQASGRLVSEDYHLLFYYHNRLTGYPLEAASTLVDDTTKRSTRILASLAEEEA